MCLKTKHTQDIGIAFGEIDIPEEIYLTDAELWLLGEQLAALNAQYAQAANACRTDERRAPAHRKTPADRLLRRIRNITFAAALLKAEG